MICDDERRDRGLTRRLSTAAARALACASHLLRGYLDNHRVMPNAVHLGQGYLVASASVACCDW
jgi:hypothetical protein